MKLPEAIALMREGKIAVDARGVTHRVLVVSGFKPDRAVAFFYSRVKGRWRSTDALCWDGWREATPEELKEIDMEPRA